MLKIMIVDDMPIFREFLRSAIDWKAHGFEVCCEAKNGMEALEMASIYEPDIILSDITMPYMNGLELAEALNSQNSDTAVVLITGNSEFEYARKAVKLGVADYIVKPFEKEELVLTLLGLQDNITRAQEQREKNEQMLLEKRGDTLRQLIYRQDVSERDELNAKRSIGMSEGHTHFIVSALELDGDIESPDNAEIMMNWKDGMTALVKDSFDIEGESYAFTDYEGRVISILCFNSEEESREFDFDELNDLIGVLKEKIGYDVSIGVGSFVDTMMEMRKSYLEAIGALSYRYESGRNKVIHYDKISNESKAFGFYSAEINEKILNHLSQGNLEMTLDTLESVFIEADEKNYSLEYRHMVYMGLISLLMSHIVKSGKSASDIFTSDFKPYEILRLSGSDSKQKDFIVNAYRSVIEYIVAHKETRSSQVASSAKAYIDAHYSSTDISIGDLSKALLVNQTYLRKMFKAEMGMTISDYLTKVRMDASKNLIDGGAYKLSYIAELVGYSDSGYFSKCFKKHFGISPSQYRESSK